MQRPFVFCTDIEELCGIVQEMRECEQKHLKFGIDAPPPSSFLKVALSIQNTQGTTEETRRQNYVDGVAAKKFKDTRVKKLLLLGLVPSTQENHMNVLKLWSLLKINDLKGTVATDLKLANVLMGIMAHFGTYPCTWCTALKVEFGEYRTLGDCLKNYDDWVKVGSMKSNAKNFKNCINKPVIQGDQNEEVIDFIPPPELHLLIGIVNKLYDHMMEDFEEDALEEFLTENIWVICQYFFTERKHI